jgi:hypothetical protein
MKTVRFAESSEKIGRESVKPLGDRTGGEPALGSPQDGSGRDLGFRSLRRRLYASGASLYVILNHRLK